ncbi:NAD(P)-dependent oxidoreductase [Fluviicola sp.]|uniref:NAD-dependent epimerase/dehydratase family protein n=1 Tax=Fluviicola sp. TaxID=1917219 RepID=UPI0031CEDA9D
MQGKEKILITGASGFIGKSLLKKIDFDRYDVAILTRNPQKFGPGERFRVVEGDLSDQESLNRALSGITVLINLAAEVRNPDKLEETNIGGTERLIAAIREAGTVKQVIHLSSVGVVGMNYSLDPTVVNEQFPAHPKNEYERTKLISEKLFLSFFKETPGLHWSVLRPTNVFGAFHPFDALLNLMQHVRNGKRILYTRSAKVNYVYVEDLTAFILNRLEATGNGIYNVGNSMDLKAFLDDIAHELGTSLNATRLPKWAVKLFVGLKIRKLDSVSNEVVYSDKALRAHFQYPFGVKEGIRQTIDYYKHLNKL